MPCEADVSSKSRSTLFFSQAGAGMNTGAPSKAAGTHRPGTQILARAARLDMPRNAFAHQDVEFSVPAVQYRRQLRAAARIRLYTTRHQQRAE